MALPVQIDNLRNGYSSAYMYFDNTYSIQHFIQHFILFKVSIRRVERLRQRKQLTLDRSRDSLGCASGARCISWEGPSVEEIAVGGAGGAIEKLHSMK